MKRLISLLAVTLSTLAVLLAQSNTAPAIHGRIVDDLRREPLARVGITAQITFKNGERKGVSVSSDPQGRFTIPITGAGRYFLTVGNPGYLGLQDELAIDGPDVDLGDLVMTIGRSISGSVRGVSDPTKVRIQALHVKQGKVIAEPEGGNSTYPRPNGEFQLGVLRPGRYVIHAQVLDMESPNSRPAPPIFFPGRATPDIKSPIDLRDTAQFSGVQIVVEDRPGISISGTVAPSVTYPAGTPVGLILMVRDLDSALPNFGAAVAIGQSSLGQRFSFAAVPSGAYTFWIMVPDPDSGKASVRRTPIDVSTQAIADLRLQVPEPGLSISGKVEIEEGNGTPSTPVASIFGQVSLFADMTRSPISDENGNLTLKSIDPAERIVVSHIEAPRDSYVSRVVQGSQDLSNGPYAFMPGGDTVRILLRKDGGTIEGRVNDGDKPARQAFVVLAPSDRSAVSRYRTVTVKLLDGSFQIPDVAPGAYELFALDRNEEDQYLDPAYLRQFAQKGTAISLSPRSSQSVQLQAIKTR